MIKFKNINGDVFLAVGSVKRKSALNGEKSLSATITQGDDVLNKIDKGWSLEFDNEPYVVTYFERNDNDNTVEIDAIHKFFWDMTKSVLYATYSSSHVARFYLDEIFKDTGYTYALNFDPKAFEKENWGMKNKLSLFNDIISSIGAEFEINGTLISIFKNVGGDLSTIVRHGFNLSDMTLENDNANFATYGEGFGAYDDKENQKGPRLHVTYTSPLAKAFGKLHAEPIVDERYTVKDNLLSAVKDKVDSSFAVSVKLSLYDLTAAGYPYKMANVGDWLLAVDEHLDFKQNIRIISVDDEFAEDGTRISYTVMCGDVGVTKKYQDANATLTQKVQSAYANAQIAKDAAIQAVISSTGKNTIYDNIDGEENLPKTANEGDLAFVQIGDGQAMYVYTKMPDGSFKWVKRLDPDTGEQIAAGVEEAISTANKYTDELNEKQTSEVAKFKSETTTALNSASADRERISKQATDMTNSAMARANEVASKADEIDGKVVAVGKSIDGLTGIVNDKNKGLSAVFDLASNGQTLAVQAQKDATTAITTAQGVQTTVKQSQDDIQKLQDKLNAQGQVNQLMNTEFTPDMEGWTLTADSGSNAPYKSGFDKNAQANMVGFNTINSSQSTAAMFQQDVLLGQAGGGYISLSWQSWAPTFANYANIWIRFYGSNNQQLDATSRQWTPQKADGTTIDGLWTRQKAEGIAIPANTTRINVSFQAREGINAYLVRPMLVFDATIGDYVAGNYNNNNLVESVRTQLAGQITDEVNDRENGDNTTRTQLTNLIDQRVTSVEEGYQSYFDQKANGILLGVGKPNQLTNTEFSPDLDGWNVSGSGNFKPYRSYIDNAIGSVSIGFGTVGAPTNSTGTRIEQTISLASSGTGNKLSMRWDVRTTQNDNYTNLWLVFLDGNGQGINQSINHQWSGPVDNAWHEMKWENVQVPDNARQVRVSFQVRENTRQYLARPMLVFGSTIGSYLPGSYSSMNTSTVMGLLKDNWYIGIADNIGKITNGIIGDNNSISLISNNITLTGNTTVTADFYAKGGNFKNLNASNFTTGTINAAKINVINLDVSSLSGNITNFIKSYWNNAYSNVTIDANGMSVTSGKKRTDFRNGAINIQTQRGENLGFLGTSHLTQDDTVDYLTLSLNGYRTTKPGDDHYDPSSKDFYGGDGISFDVSGPNGQYGPIMRWNSDYAANVIGTDSGWQVLDRMYVEKGLYAHNAHEHWRVSWTAWSDWGNYKNVSLTNTKGSAGIAVNDDNLILFGTNKRTDGTKGWKV